MFEIVQFINYRSIRAQFSNRTRCAQFGNRVRGIVIARLGPRMEVQGVLATTIGSYFGMVDTPLVSIDYDDGSGWESRTPWISKIWGLSRFRD